MKKYLPLTLILVLFSLQWGSAQAPCGVAGDEPPGCTLCGPVYSGNTAGFTPGTSIPGFCGTIENNQWLSFQAAAVSATVSITSFNCQNGQGVQLYMSDTNLNPVSNCFSSGGNNIPGNVTATGLTPGDIYYIMIDGFAGDVCDIIINLVGGINTGPPDPPGPIQVLPNQSPICPGATVCYSIPPVNNASDYEWTLPSNGVIVSTSADGTQICVEWTDPGGGAICVTPSNPCFPGFPSCTPVIVIPLPPVILPPETICTNDFPIDRDGHTFTSAGTYDINVQNALGCDSTTTYIFIPLLSIPHFIIDTLCIGDCITVNNQFVCNSGNTEIIIPGGAANGCDSTIFVALTFFDPIAIITEPIPELDCSPNATVTIDASGSSTGANYNWLAQNGGNIVSGQGTTSIVVNQPGTYVLEVTQTNSSGLTCTSRDTALVILQTVILDQPVFTAADVSLCEGEIGTYTIDPVAGANSYNWTVPTGATITSNSGTTIQVDFTGASSGNVCVVAVGDCSDSPEVCVPVTIKPNPTSDFTVEDPICQTNSSTITFTGSAGANATFNWNFNGGTPATVSGPGPHIISWASVGSKTITLSVDDDGCASPQTTHTVQVDAVLADPVINCTSTQTSITFSWDPIAGATNYEVIIDAVSQGTQTDTFFVVSGLAPGTSVDITVIANGSTACGPSSSNSDCIAQNCPPVVLTIDPVSDICRDASTQAIQLTGSQAMGNGGGNFTWDGSGTSASGLFDPTDPAVGVGPNVITMTYSEGTCEWTEPITINVYDPPTADFSVTDTICVNSTSTILYTGNAGAGATFNWGFDGGTIQSGSGSASDPYEIMWATAGTYNVTLEVIENGCPSGTNLIAVQVDDILADPVISCVPTNTTSEVQFSWTPVPGADSYSVNGIDLSGGTGTYDATALTYTVTGLSPGDLVTIEVVATGASVCGSSSATFVCEAINCTYKQLIITQVGPYCDEDPTLSTVQLDFSVDAGSPDPAGTITWNGPGVDPTTGIFDPNAPTVNPGQIPVGVSYEIDNCLYDTTMNITIHPKPLATFGLDGVICITDVSEVNYVGDPSGKTFNWDFGLGTPSGDINGPGPIDVSWTNQMTDTVRLTVIENSCPSDEFVQAVQIDSLLGVPQITCTEDQNNINFSWNNVSGASSFDVVLLSGEAGAFDPATNTYDVSGLVPGQTSEIEVTANGFSVCGPTKDTLLCTAKDCLPIVPVLAQVPNICLDNSTTSISMYDYFTLTGSPDSAAASINWDDGNGDNTYITLGGQFFPNAAFLAIQNTPAQVRVTWVEPNGCVYTASTFIITNATPLVGLNGSLRICMDDVNTISVSPGPSDPAAVFNWIWGDADHTLSSGGVQGAGPYDLTWTTGGLKNVGLQVTANGCPSDTANAFIFVDEPLSNFSIDCQNVNATSVGFSWPSFADVNYEVTIDDAPAAATSNQPDDLSIVFSNLIPLDEVTITVIMTSTDTLFQCDSIVVTQTCVANSCPTDVTVSIEQVDPICLDNSATTVQLVETIGLGATLSGNGTDVWSGTGVSSDGFFDPNSAGTGTHTVTYTYTEISCVYTASMDIVVNALPYANAGSDALLTCFQTSTVLGGDDNINNNCTCAIFTWSGGNVADPNAATTTASEAGTYTLTVYNPETGCTFSDEVTVEVSNEVPIITPELNNITCFGSNDGIISINGVVNGTPPYQYSFNGGPFGSQNYFANLGPGDYEIILLDANGCRDTSDLISIDEPDEISVEITITVDNNPWDENEPIDFFADSIQLDAVVNILDSNTIIQWSPEGYIPLCDEVNVTNCASILISPTGQTIYSVHVENANGCADDDLVQLNIEKERPVYIPSGFSPTDNDGTNDIFRIYADTKIVPNVKAFLVFDRWGEKLYEDYDFDPGDSSPGWDGKFRNKLLNPGVYVYFAEIEFYDGVVEIFKGDVTLK